LWADPRNPSYRNLHAVVLSRVGDVQRSSEIYAKLLREYPRNAKVWLSYGHVLKTAGRRDDCVTAYRNCLALEPALGEAYWSLANLKTFRFTDQDLQHMRQHLENTSLETSHRVHLHFAMGKAMEDTGDYRESFAHYERGNRLQRERQPYDAKLNAQRMQRLKRVFTREFFAERSAAGHEAADPIFIVGMPRAGSTLLEQILSSHSAVEGTSELPDVIALARELRAAKIIDARRHPLACCFSNFKQFYARGQRFSYALEDAGGYYRDYVELMAHYDVVLPGRVHRVIYEELIDDTEREVRRLLDYCGLPFEPACLRFFENDRPVRTASSEQVRRPIYREGLDQWRHYEPWLGPLKAALGPVLDSYPAAPLCG
ncbi:MAG: sulfotransferase family protein, partial [Gammaproteobacteria bacterium]|nr:sulfotransferase family protein [Gammaproteobacteria bacterium]